MSNDLHTILTGYKRKLETVIQKSCKEAGRRLHHYTPELSGDLKESWIEDPSPEQLRIGDTYRIGTDSPYGPYIEYLSPPARNSPETKYADIGQPYGMVRRTVAEWQQIVDGASHGS